MPGSPFAGLPKGGQPRRLSPHVHSLLPAIQACDSERIRRPGRFGKSSTFHPRQHFFRWREPLDRGWEVGIGTADAGDQGAYARQDLFEIDAVERPHHALRRAEIEDAAFCPRTQYANNLPQSGIVVGEIAETKCRSLQIEVRTRKRKIEGVGFDPVWP